LRQAKQIKKESLVSYQDAFSQIKSSSRLIGLIDLAREFIYLQTYRMDIFFLAHFHIYPFLEIIGERFCLKVAELVYLTGDEITRLLEGKRTLNKQEIKNRINDYALIEINGKYTILAGNQVRKKAQKISKGTIVRGMIANRGRASGRVKVVNDVEEMAKVNKGDIVVSLTTHPKLMPAIIKASGIITDRGGILCHAAIVSREFGIPCIVGTNNATKVFKDGDMVELNAYEGMARKIDI